MRITHWTVKVTWEDGREEYLDDIPNYVASAVDDYLTELEEVENEFNNEEQA
jgi:hypothetical protein